MEKGKHKGVQQENQEEKYTSTGHALRPYKRSRIAGGRLLITDDGFTTLNPDMPNRRVVDTGIRASRRSDVITGILATHHKEDSNGRKNKPLPSILKQLRDEKRIQTSSRAAANNQSQSSTSRKPPKP